MKHFKRTSPKPLGELLIERGVITHDQLQVAIAHQQKSGGLFGEILVQLKFATEKDIAQALTCQYGFPYLPLANYEIDMDVLKTIPVEICRKLCVIPIDKIGRSLTLAMANPLNVTAAEEIEQLTGCSVQTFVSTVTEIKQAIDTYYKKST